MFNNSLVLQRNRHPNNTNDKAHVNRTKSNRASFDSTVKAIILFIIGLLLLLFVNEDYRRENGYEILLLLKFYHYIFLH